MIKRGIKIRCLTRIVVITCLLVAVLIVSGVNTWNAEAAILGPAPDNPYKDVVAPNGTLILYTDVNLSSYPDRQIQWPRATVNNAAVTYANIGYVGAPYWTNMWKITIPYTGAQYSQDHDISFAYRVYNGTWNSITAQDFKWGRVTMTNKPTCAGPIFSGKPSGECSLDISTSLSVAQRSNMSYLITTATGNTCAGTTMAVSNVVANDTHITNTMNVTIQPTTDQCNIKFDNLLYYPSLAGTCAFANNIGSSDPIPVYVSSISDTGCPAMIKDGQNFTCNPTIVKNLLPEHQTGATYTWTTDSGTLTQSATDIPNPTLMITGATQSPKLTLTVHYPVVDYTITAQSAAIPQVSANITALNCPTALFNGQNFTCNPAITTALSSEYQTGATYTWTTDSGTLTQSATDIPNPTLMITGATQSPKLTLTVYYPAVDLTVSQAMTEAVPIRILNITSAGCPANALSTKSFTCAPVINTNIPEAEQGNIIYNWTSDGLVINEDLSLSFPNASGNKTLTLTASLGGNTVQSTSATVNMITPQTTVSLTCSESIFTEESITCTPEITTNLPEEFKAGMTKAWTGEGLVVNQDGSMKFTTEGTKTATFTMSYPLANYEYTTTKSFTVTKPTLAVTSLNCPAEVLVNENITCTPEITTNLPDNYKANIQKAWTGEGMVITDNKISFITPGQQTINLQLSYPGADSVTATASIAIGGSSIAITSLGCPAELKTQESFTCTPVIETDMTQAYKDKLTYTWSSGSMETADDGSMAMIASGNKSLTLTVALPEKNISVKKTDYINVILSDTNIKASGCPSSVYYGIPFTCTPDVETVGDPNSLQFTWSGATLSNDSNGKLLFTTSESSTETIGKVTLTVTNPETGFVAQKTQKVRIIPVSVVVSALGCSSKIKSLQPFTCAPVIKVNATGIKEGLKLAWSGNDLVVRENGSFVYPTEGTKTINLKVTHPEYPQIQIDQSYDLEVTKPVLVVTGLGCPRTITEYININCFPKITSDDVLGNIVYDWKLNGETIGTGKIGSTIFKAPGTSTLALTAKMVDPDTGSTIIESTFSEEKTVNPNQMPLRMYVSGPGLAERGTEIALEARTVFQVEEVMDYTWMVNGTEYKGKKITVPVPENQIEPITYSVTAKPNCCEMITAETKTGAVRVGEYRFPTVMFTGPRSFDTNVAPFDALFKTSVITTSNLTYTWDFGDGSPVETTDKTATRKTHTYTTPGTYTAKLSVTDKNNETRELTATVVVVPLPSRNLAINATMLNPYARRPVTGYFKYDITDGLRKDSPISSTWSINDEVVSDRSSALINFNEAGVHTVNLEVKTKYGNNLNTTKTVEVAENVPPVCQIMQALYAPGVYQLTANCTDPDGKVVRHKWDLGGGVTSSSSKTYLNTKIPGDYPVSLTATDDSGDSVTVNGVVSATN